MAKIITVTTSQAETEVDFGAYYQFAWVKNLSDDTDCYISDHSGASAEDDDVALVSAGSSAMIVTSGDTIYIIGSGVKCECRAQNFAECPFGDLAGESGSEITIDPTPTQGSSNAVSSGGVYTALQGVSPIDYSTMEQDTGRKWIDGKPIYQKTFSSLNITFGSGDVQKTTSIPNTTIPNIDRIIDMAWIGDDTGGSRPANPAKLDSPMVKWYNKDDACFQVFIISQYDCVLKAITTWYTKTTDTAE